MKYSLLICLFIWVACSHHTNTPPIFEVSYHPGRKSEIKVISGKEQSIIDISSESGIGGGTVKLIQGTWPETLIVRLHLKGLEGFTVSNGKLKIEKSDLSVKAYNKDGEPFTDKYLPGEQGYYEVQLPNTLFVGGTTDLEIQWIDFYR